MKNTDHDFIMPPFPGFPSVSRYVPIGPVADTVNRIARSIHAHEAISLVIGPPGTGKSLVCGLIAKQFIDSHDVVVLGETTMTDENAFLKFLLHRLGVALETNRPQDFELLLDERLSGHDANPNGLVLIIDEAASLSGEVLEAIRRVTNIMRDGRPMVSAVVAGGVKLDETLTSPAMEAFVQRVAARCYLHPLNMDETRNYIRQSIEACDSAADDTITDDAVSAIHHATGGVARLINQMMTEAIDCAADADRYMIDESVVDRAWANLQQLPGPMIEEPALKGESSVVEFGELSADTTPLETRIKSAPSLTFELDATEDTEVAYEESYREEDLSQFYSAEVTAEPQPTTEATPDNATLFGEFESEEEIEVGSCASAEPLPSTGEVDLESMLHSEIISLSNYASENTMLRDTQVTVDTAPPEDVIEEELFVDEPIPAPRAENDTTGDDTPSVVWYDEAEAAEASNVADSDRPDDTDLLWITEDIQIDQRDLAANPPDLSHRFDQPAVPDAPKLNVDYRELLAKMRKQ